MNSFLLHVIRPSLLALFLAHAALANSVDQIWLNKAKAFAQADNSVPTNPEFEFFTWVGGSFTNASATLTIPGGGVVNYPFLAGDKQFDWFDGVGSPYATKAALDAAYPNGSYVVRVQDDGLDDSVTFDFTGDIYPVTPHITNFDDLQSVNPTQDFTITWSAFSNAVPGNSFIEIAIEDAADDDISYFSQSVIPANTQSIVVPLNTLPADTVLSIYLRFYTFTDIPRANTGAIYESTVDARLETRSDALSDHVFEIEVISGYDASGLGAPEVFSEIEVDADASFNAVTVMQPGGAVLQLESQHGQPGRVRWEYEGETLLPDGDYVFTFNSASGSSQTTITYLRADHATPLSMPDLQPAISGLNAAGFISGTPASTISWNSSVSDPKIAGMFVDVEPKFWEFTAPGSRQEVERSPGEDDAAGNAMTPNLPGGVYDMELVFYDGRDETNADGISYWVSRERIHQVDLVVSDPTGPAASMLGEIEMWSEWSAAEHYVEISVQDSSPLSRVKVRTPNEFEFELSNNGSGQWSFRQSGVDSSVFDTFGDGVYSFLLESQNVRRELQQAMTHAVYLNSDLSPLILPSAAASFTAPAPDSSNDSPVDVSWASWNPGDPAYSEPGASIALEVTNDATDDEFSLDKSATTQSVTLGPGTYNATLFFDNSGPDDSNGDGISLSYGKASRDDLSFSIAGGGPAGVEFLEDFDAVATGFGISQLDDDGETIAVYENPDPGTPNNSTGRRASWGDSSAPDAEVLAAGNGNFLRLYSDMPAVPGPEFVGILDFPGFGPGSPGGPFVDLDGDDVRGSTVSFEIRLPAAIDYDFYVRVLFTDTTQLSGFREDVEYEEFVTQPLPVSSAFPGVWQSISFEDLQAGDFTSLDGTGHTFSGQSDLFALEFLVGDGSGNQDFFDLDDVSLTFAGGDSPSFTGSVSAPQPTAVEEGGNGSFEISIGAAAPAGGVDVVVDLSGTAQLGQDYHLRANGGQLPATSPVTITVPQGASSVDVIVEPVDDANPEIDETVILDLVSVDGEAASGQETVTIGYSDIAYFVLWVNRETVNGVPGVGEAGHLNWWMVAPIGKTLVSATFTMANGESYQAEIVDDGERADLEAETVFGRDGVPLAELQAKMQSGTYTALLTYSDSSTETRQGNFTWGAWPAFPVISSPSHYSSGINAASRVTAEWIGGQGWVSLEQHNGPFANARVDYFESEWLSHTGNHSYEIPVTLLPNQSYEIDVLSMSGDMGSITQVGISTGQLPTFSAGSDSLSGTVIGEWPDGTMNMTKRYPNGSEEAFTRVVSRESVSLPGFNSGTVAALRWSDSFADGSVHDNWSAKGDTGAVFSVRAACGASVGNRVECGGVTPTLLVESGATVGSKWYSGDEEEPTELVSLTATAPNAQVDNCVYLRVVWEGEGSEHWWYKPGIGLVENHMTYGADTTAWFLTPGLAQAATPAIAPDGGSHTGPTPVTLSSATNGADIYYTTDGSPPSDTSMLYAGPFTLSESATVQAIAYATAHAPSEIASASFTLTPAPLTAAFNLPAINEDSGIGTVYLNLTRGGDLSLPLTVNLSNDDPTELRIPQNTVVFASGRSTLSIQVEIEDDFVVDDDATVTVTATAPAHSSAQASIIVRNLDRQVTVINGTDVTNAAPYRAGDVVAIEANIPAEMQFNGWASTAGTLADPTLAFTTFTVPASHADLTAQFSPATPASPPFAILAIPDQQADQDDEFSLDLAPYFREPNGDAMSFASSGLPDGLQLAPTTGLITGAPTVAGEFIVSVTVSGPQASSIPRTFSIDVRAVNHAPSPADASLTVPEDAVPGTVVHTLLPNDPDGGDSHTFSIVGGSDAFEVTADGDIRVARANILDYETAPTLVLTLQVTDDAFDSLSGTATLTVNIDDANDKPTDLTLASDHILDSFAGVAVGEVMVVDQDVLPQFRDHTLELVDSPRFEIVNSTLMLKPGVRVLAQAEPELTVTIRAREGAGVPIIRSFTLDVTAISTQSFDLASDSPIGTDIGVMTQLLAEGAADPIFQISAPQYAPFAIDPTTGRLSTAGLCPLDGLNSPIELLVQLVESADSSVLDSGVAQITIIEPELAPVIHDQAFTLAPAAPNGTVVGHVAAYDPNGDALSVAISAGNDAGVFALDGGGELTVADAGALDFANTAEYLLTVSADDAQGSTEATIRVRSESQLDVIAVYSATPVERSVATSETVFFITNTPAEGREVWGHDGDSLSLLADILPGAGSGVPEGARLALHNGIAYLPASNGSEGLELWRSDGTPAGTEIVSDLAPGAADSSPTPIASSPDGLLFVTETVDESRSGPADCEVTQIVERRELWVTDGTAPGTLSRASIPDSVSISNCLSSIANSQHLSELLVGSPSFYSIDTQLDLSFGIQVRSSQLWQLGDAPADNSLLFTTDDASIDGLRRIGGALALQIHGDLKIHHSSTGMTHTARTSVSDIAAFHGHFYSLSAGASAGLYRTAPNSLCNEQILSLPDEHMSALSVRQDRLYFQVGNALWSSDGTAAGSSVIHTFGAVGTAGAWITANERVYFIWEGQSGSALWQTDGTPDGTLAVPLNADSETLTPLSLTAGGNDLYIIANTPTIDRGLFRLPAETPDPPEITGQAPLVSSGDGAISISVDDLLLSNVDPVARASGIQFELVDGDNYSISNDDIVPDPGFSGTLYVPVRLFIDDVFKDEFVLTVQVVAQIDGALQFAESASSLTEFDGVHRVAVALELGAGQETIDEVTVTVVDLGTGSASAGTDYALLANSVVFPAGSRDGRIAFLPLQIFANDSNESPNETIDLALTTITGTGNLSTGSTSHTVITIEDALQTVVSATVVYAGAQQGDLRVQVRDQEQTIQDFLGGAAIDLQPLPEGNYELQVFVDSDNDLRPGRSEATASFQLSIGDSGGADNIGTLTLVDPSLDADDLPDYWEQLHFGDLVQKNADDPDGDDIPNNLEFEHGLDPLANDPLASRPSVTLTLSSSGDGSTVPAAGGHSYKLGETVTLSATAGGLSTFIGWTGALETTGSPADLVILGDSTVTAHFAVDPTLHLPVFEVTPDLIVLNIGDSGIDLTAGVTLTDEHQADVINELQIGGDTVDTAAPGEFLVTYSWFDDILGATRELSRLYVVVDQTAPILTIDPLELEIEAGDSPPEVLDSVSATDNADGNLDDDIQSSGNLDPDRVGEYTVNYRVSDQSGNVSTGTRTYRVVDTVAPVLTLSPDIVDLGLGEPIDFLDGVSATDVVDGNIGDRVRYSGELESPGMGEFTVTYRVSDVAGNSSTDTRLYRIGCSTLNGTVQLDLDDPTAFLEVMMPNGDVLNSAAISAAIAQGPFTQRVAEIAITLGNVAGQSVNLAGSGFNLAADERYRISGEDLDVTLALAPNRVQALNVQVTASCADIHAQRFNLVAALEYSGPQQGALRADLNAGAVAVSTLGIIDQDDLKPGNYVLNAYLDANDSGSRDPWEAAASVTEDLQDDAFLGLLELLDPDTDSDELPDWWEIEFFGNLDQGPEDDPDFDHVSNRLELAGETHPNDAANPDAAPTFAVTITVLGDGVGVTSLAAGQHSFAFGTLVDVTAFPDAGNFFAGWTGAAHGLGTASLRITKDIELIATFSSEPAYYIPLRKGWNLIGSPVDSAQTVGEIFVNDNLRKTRVGGVFAWDGSALVPVGDDETLRANQGYWVHVPRRGMVTQLITGQLGGGLELVPGWNLVSVPELMPLPDHPAIQAILTYDGERHRAATGPLEVLNGYWIRADQPLSIPLAP